MSSEIELKFRIPAARLTALRRAVATRGAQVQPLVALYFDTPGELLAHARVALRLRREGEIWVQTLKAEGADAMHRLEHNVVVAGKRQPGLDLSRHDGSAAGQVLRALLAGARDEPLLLRYATEVQRTRRLLRAGDARIELALDEGHITAGRHRLPICELELELLAGTPQALLDVAGRWVDRFGLVLDVRSKSERGHRLAAGMLASPPTKARPLRLPADATPAQALAAMLANALDQVLANASAMADADLAEVVTADAEYLHQLRVGLRRLRSLLRVYGPLAPPADAALAPALATLFGQLGAARDQDAMAEWLWPALRDADAPWVPDFELDAGTGTGTGTAVVMGGGLDIAALLRTPATQRLWLSALAACQPPAGQAAALPAESAGSATPAEPSAPPAPAAPARQSEAPLREAVRLPLQQLMRQVKRDAAGFSTLDHDARHRLRRRIKRLRYAADAAASLWPAKSVAATLRALTRAQEPLGHYNDTVVALDLFRTLAAQDGRAWFVVGWLTARREALAAPCVKALARLSRVRGFWRRR
ncbi:MAG: CYTH and CHAD domain-containing protein [Microbacteriaceae bacterium]|nr:CYTH and CHAD domain-containing protein [Burkholderiaceae bacterium]